TVINLLALEPDFLVIRQGEPLELSLPYETSTVLINGGDGINEHPTQALLDCFTLLEHFQAVDLVKKHILIVGDIAHSRVAHSNIKLMARLGARVTLLAPRCFRPNHNIGQGYEITVFSELLSDVDAVMCLRVQKERFSSETEFDAHEFAEAYGLSRARLNALGPSCVVLHPGPMNIGVEIDADVATDARSLINEQVRNGVAIRAALMEFYDRSRQ
ncbi:MAG TPA: aspartate carbamoyltransferase, partial [Myxococcota bacterium]|nr:aspartate carbamoyltransferase [Myxococcota bacterium]